MKIRTSRDYLLPTLCAPRFNDGGDGGGGDGGSGDGGSGGGSYTPPASQADLDKIVESRLARERAKYADYDAVKAKADKHDALEAELSSDKDKAVAAAREEERKKITGETTPRIVRAEFKAEAKGVLTTEQLDTLLEDLDLSKYVDDKGEPDAEKIAKKVKAFAPAGGNGGTAGKPRSLGQGNKPPADAKPGDQGRAMAQKRFGDKARQS